MVVEPQPLRAIAVGKRRTCTIRDNGTLRCWGGDVDTASCDEAYSQEVELEGVVAVSTWRRVCAVTSDGAVYCWNLGSEPKRVEGIDTAVDITVGLDASCALLTDATVRCWGSNDLGQLGSGTTIDSDIPVEPIGL
jgi:alpha-tubulin suppressor-like RCC1 family protein